MTKEERLASISIIVYEANGIDFNVPFVVGDKKINDIHYEHGDLMLYYNNTSSNINNLKSAEITEIYKELQKYCD